MNGGPSPLGQLPATGARKAWTARWLPGERLQMAQLGKKLCSHLGGISLFFLMPLPTTHDNVIGRENLKMLHVAKRTLR